MTHLSGKSKEVLEIVEALGIKHCKGLKIDMRPDSLVTVEAEFYPEANGLRTLASVFKKYNLVPIDESAK